MRLKEVKELCSKDLDDYRAFKRIVEQGDFNTKGSALIRVAHFKQWFDGLESKIMDAIGKLNELRAKNAMADAKITEKEEG